MGVERNLEYVRELMHAKDVEDFDKYGDMLAEDAVFRMAGVPEAFGGVMRGRDVIMDEFRRTAGYSKWQTHRIFGDENNVCVMGITSVREFPGSDMLRSGTKGYVTDECVTYRFEDGVVVEITAYINWLHAYVQAGIIDVGALVNDADTAKQAVAAS